MNTLEIPINDGSCQQTAIGPPKPLTFRNSRIVYYGPHACDNCGVLVARMGHEFGGNRFTYPSGPIYPNTEWHPHVCDPSEVCRHAELLGPAHGSSPEEKRSAPDMPKCSCALFGPKAGCSNCN